MLFCVFLLLELLVSLGRCAIHALYWFNLQMVINSCTQCCCTLACRTCGTVLLTFTGSQKHLLKEAHHTLGSLTPIPLQSKLLIEKVVKDLRTNEKLG